MTGSADFPGKGLLARVLFVGAPRGSGGPYGTHVNRRGFLGYETLGNFQSFPALGYETFGLLAASGGFLVAAGGYKSRTLVLFWASWCPQAAQSLVP